MPATVDGKDCFVSRTTKNDEKLILTLLFQYFSFSANPVLLIFFIFCSIFSSFSVHFPMLVYLDLFTLLAFVMLLFLPSTLLLSPCPISQILSHIFDINIGGVI